MTAGRASPGSRAGADDPRAPRAPRATAPRAIAPRDAAAGATAPRTPTPRATAPRDDAPRPASASPARLDLAERARRIHAILDERFPAPAIPLDHGDPFQLLVAVVLSAQCTDARVNLVTPALFARAPDAAAMAQMSARDLQPYIATCGLAPAKAKNLAATARLLVERHGGAVPRSFDELEALPGVGHKTASVVMAQAFGEPAFPVDTHIHRLAGRWGLSRARTVEEVERDLKRLYPRDRWNALHLQIIYFGRTYCPARGHDIAACPICAWAMSKTRAAAERRAGSSRPAPATRA